MFTAQNTRDAAALIQMRFARKFGMVRMLPVAAFKNDLRRQKKTSLLRTKVAWGGAKEGFVKTWILLLKLCKKRELRRTKKDFSSCERMKCAKVHLRTVPRALTFWNRLV
jgi:hypothetical protein